MVFNWLKHRTARRRSAAGLYQTARTQSRDPVFYAHWGVADTMDGRFDLLALHVALMMERLGALGPEGAKLAQALFDCMFKDIELTLRETGVGDLGVPKHMARMMKAFNGRVHVYHAALGANDEAALNVALNRNIYRGNEAANGGELARYILAACESLNRYDLQDFQRGNVSYQNSPAFAEAAHG